MNGVVLGLRVCVASLLAASVAACGSSAVSVRTPDAPADGARAPAPATSEDIPGFTIPRDQPMLLPFWARVEKLARVLDLPLTDPAFAKLYEDRLQLGDYDHASGVAPDPLWSASKITAWVDDLRPVCAHPNMRARHEWLVGDLMRDAYGRDPTVEEITGIKDELDEAGLVGALRDETACLAILSSLEVVAQ